MQAGAREIPPPPAIAPESLEPGYGTLVAGPDVEREVVHLDVGPHAEGPGDDVALGVVGGLLFAKGIESLFSALGIGLPTTALVVATRTVIVSVLIGLAVTLIAVLNPALRSTRVPPIAAMQNIELTASRRRSVVTARSGRRGRAPRSAA